MISRSTDQLQERDCVLSQVIVRKSTSSKPKAPTTVILRDSIVKNLCGNINTKFVKHRKHVVVKHFSGAKTADINHYKKPAQEKSPAEIIINGSTNDLSSDKYYANDTMQFKNQLKLTRAK